MKKYMVILLAAFSTLSVTACEKSSDGIPQTPEMPAGESNILVAYFSQSGNTQRIARQIAELTGADTYRILAADPYEGDGYPDTDRVQDEAYNDRRPGVTGMPENLDDYDVIFVGTPIWWHQPAMVVCTFLDNYDLSGKTIVPFVTFGARSYLNETMQKIYALTPDSDHLPAELPEDLDPGNIREPQSDDAGIDMPTSAGAVEAWLRGLGLLPEA